MSWEFISSTALIRGRSSYWNEREISCQLVQRTLHHYRPYSMLTDSAVTVIFNFAGKRQGPPTNVSVCSSSRLYCRRGVRLIIALQVARQVLHILSAHYPETLASSIFQNMPWVVKAFINLMWPFVDPVTKKKVKFANSEDRSLVKEGEVDADQLLVDCGGDLDVSWNRFGNLCNANDRCHITTRRTGSLYWILASQDVKSKKKHLERARQWSGGKSENGEVLMRRRARRAILRSHNDTITVYRQPKARAWHVKTSALSSSAFITPRARDFHG